MGSPKMEVFFLYSSATGDPLTGQAGIHFDTYKNDLGSDLPQPAIGEIGGGAYGFTPAFTDPSRGIAYIIHTGAGATPARVARFMRPEDWNADNADVLSSSLSSQSSITTLQADVTTVKSKTSDMYVQSLGRWKIDHNTAKLTIYNPGGSVFREYNLKDEHGNPNSEILYERDPV